MKFRDNRGSITVFVLVALLFMTGFLIISFGSNINKSKTAKEQFDILSSTYSYGDGDANSYKRAYTAIRKRNATILNKSLESDNSSLFLLEIDKTFDDNLIDFKIYGNSVQNGIPSETTPVEIQSVGDKNNLIDYSKAKVRNDITNDSPEQYLDIDEAEQSITWTGDFYFEIPLPEDVKIPSGKTICLSLNSTNNTITKWTVVYANTASDQSSINTSITTTEEVLAVRCYIDMGDIDTDNKETVTTTVNNIMLEYGTIPTGYITYGKYRIQIETSGNLIDFSKVQSTSGTTTTVLDNGFNVNGIYAGKIMNIKVKPNTDYYLQYVVETISGTTKNVTIFPNDSTSTRIARFESNEGGTFNTGNNTSIQIWFYAGAGTSAQGEINFTDIQLTKGTEKKEIYEPFYKEPVTIDIIIDEPLRKVENVEDYIDFSTGRVVRKIGKIENYNNENITTEWMSSTGKLSNGATVYYVLETPKNEEIEVPDVLTYEDYTSIHVSTEISPSKIEVSYYGYTME